MNEAQEREILSRLFVKLSDVEARPKEYIFRPYLPVGKLTMISAEPGIGKTKLGDAIAAAVSAGLPICGSPCLRQGPVIVFSTEDDVDDHKMTVESCGGDMDLCNFLSDKDEALDYLAKSPLTFGSWIVESAIKLWSPALVVFDPLQRYVGKTDTNSQTDTTIALAPAVKLAKKYDCAIILVSHNGKAHDNLQAKAMGSTNIVGMMRSMLSIVRDPEQPSENIAIHTKSNNAKGLSLRYRIDPTDADPDYAKVTWLGAEEYDEREYNRAKRRVEQAKAESAISDEDPVVQTVLHLMEENPRGVRIGRADMAKAVESVGNDFLREGLEKTCKRYGPWMAKNHCITMFTRPSQKIVPFNLMGVTVLPEKSPDRVISIQRSGGTKHTNSPDTF